jgi:hypothetical protein
MVPKAGLEPAHPKALPSEDSVSANFTTSAKSLTQKSYSDSIKESRGICMTQSLKLVKIHCMPFID